VTSIFVLDDQIVVRQGLKQILREEFRDLRFGEASTAAETLSWFEQRRWDVAVIEIHLKDRDGMEVLAEVRRRQPECRVVVLTDLSGDRIAARVLQLGAWAFVSKRASRHDLVRSFAQVLAGRKVFPRDFAPHMLNAAATHPTRKLSERERAVLYAVTSGKGSGEIAAELNLSVQTISTYRRRIREKLGLKSTADMVRYVIEQRMPNNGFHDGAEAEEKPPVSGRSDSSGSRSRG
jgi:DNA-binding NarL/FixJ family response regulator